ncbi:hypothetical protein As57867_007047, partial [Aphanomyces stellatus]
TRLLIPVIVYRLTRCTDADEEIFEQMLEFVIFFSANTASVSGGGRYSSEEDYDSQLLYSTVVFSEMWRRPTPSLASLKKTFDEALVATKAYTLFPHYCVFSNDSDPECAPYKRNVAFTYPLDKYAHQQLKIPRKASVLILNGGLDPQTPLEGAQAQFESLVGHRKKLIVFPTAPHAISYVTWLESRETTCGVLLIASYVRTNGNLNQLDTSCTSKTQRFSFQVSKRVGQIVAGVDDIYDGVHFVNTTIDEETIDHLNDVNFTTIKNSTQSFMNTTNSPRLWDDSTTSQPLTTEPTTNQSSSQPDQETRPPEVNTTSQPDQEARPPEVNTTMHDVPAVSAAVGINAEKPSTSSGSMEGLLLCLVVVSSALAVKFYIEVRTLRTQQAQTLLEEGSARSDTMVQLDEDGHV